MVLPRFTQQSVVLTHLATVLTLVCIKSWCSHTCLPGFPHIVEVQFLTVVLTRGHLLLCSHMHSLGVTFAVIDACPSFCYLLGFCSHGAGDQSKGLAHVSKCLTTVLTSQLEMFWKSQLLFPWPWSANDQVKGHHSCKVREEFSVHPIDQGWVPALYPGWGLSRGWPLQTQAGLGCGRRGACIIHHF